MLQVRVLPPQFCTKSRSGYGAAFLCSGIVNGHYNCELCSHGGADARRLATAFWELRVRGNAPCRYQLNASRGGAGSGEDCNCASDCSWNCVHRRRRSVSFETLICSREITSGADNNKKLLQLPVSVHPRLRASRVAMLARVCVAYRAIRRASAVAVPRVPRVPRAPREAAVPPAHGSMRRRNRELRPRPTAT